MLSHPLRRKSKDDSANPEANRFSPYIVETVSTVDLKEEGTGITSDVVKVKGEDPATPGLLP